MMAPPLEPLETEDGPDIDYQTGRQAPKWLRPVTDKTQWLQTKKFYAFIALVVLAIVLATNIGRAPSLVQHLFPQCPRPNFTSSPAYCAAETSWEYDPKRDANNYALTLDQCEQAFPGLFWPIEEQIERRRNNPITEEELNRESWPPGTIRAMLYDGQLYILETYKPELRRTRPFSTFSSLMRALQSFHHDPTLPNIEFVVTIEDFYPEDFQKGYPLWAYDKTKEDNTTWLMPDFGFFNWPEPGVGAYHEVRRKMQEIEEAHGKFDQKIPMLVWRGAIVPSVAQVLRQHLVDSVEGKKWADVKVLDWHAKDKSKMNRINIEDHCKWQYIVHTEGRAWSGRLKYIQNCHSVIFCHPLQWQNPHYALMNPEGPNQNYVPVERDFSDLSEKMEYYLDHPAEARRIADNSVKTFRDRYVTPAAEACYWKKLVYGWSKVSFEPKFHDQDGNWRGVPFDSWLLMRKMEWAPS